MGKILHLRHKGFVLAVLYTLLLVLSKCHCHCHTMSNLDITVNKFQCTRCPYSSRNYLILLNHYGIIHAHEPSFSICCGIEGCHISYTNIRSLRRHILKKHPTFNCIQRSEIEQETTSDNEFQPNETESQTEPPGSVVVEQNIQTPVYNSKREICLAVLGLRETQKIPYKTCSSVLQAMCELMQAKDQNMNCSLRGMLTEKQVSAETVNDVLKQFDDECESVSHIIEDLSTPFLFNKYVEQNFAFVSPVTYNLGFNEQHKVDEMQYIPILDLLSALLKHDDIFTEVVNPHQSKDGKMRDVCDGEHFKQHPFWSGNPLALQVILYFDEFTAVNQIGTVASKYKACGVYFSLGNIRPALRSQLKSIHLALLAQSKAIKSHGVDAILSPLVKDLCLLEQQGISVSRPDGYYTFKGSVIACVADNLGSHQIGGFMESFRAFRSCRFCSIGSPDLQALHDISRVERRSIAGYQDQVKMVERDETMAPIYGIKRNSSLNKLDYFHVANGLPSDILHDLFEHGVVVDVLESVINYFIQGGNFSLNYVYDQIKEFPYKGTDKNDKPDVCAVVSKGKFRVKEKAAQVWCLLRLLPLLVGDTVNMDDDKWAVLIAALDMVESITAVEMTMADIGIMDDRIQTFFTLYLNEFPDQHMKPKDHFILHYMEQAKHFGTLRGLWTMRFEAKHSYFVDVARRTKNRKNLLKTMAMRHQYLQTLHLECVQYYHDEIKSCGGKKISVQSLDEDIQDVVQPLLPDENTVFVCKAVTVGGFRYCSESVVVRGFENDSLQFSAITYPLLIGGIPYILCKPLLTRYFNQHYHAYVVHPRSGYQLLRLGSNQLIDNQPLPLYVHRGLNLVLLHHKISFD